jgi:methyl-accepting chemotaxis protein
MVVSGWLSTSDLADVRRSSRAEGTKAVVETALSVLDHYHGQAEAGVLPVEDAQRAALDTVKSLRYGNEDYFWVHDNDLVMQMHPFKPELDGTDLSQNTDPDGVPLFVRMNEVVAADGAGFVEYQWPKPGLEDPQPKVSYVVGFEPWGWIVGSGVYVDDVEAAVAHDRQSLLINFGAVTLVMVAAILWVRQSVTSPLHRMTRVLAEGDLSATLPEGNRRTEFGRLAGAINDNLARVRGVVDGVVQASADVHAQVTQLGHYTEKIEAQAAATEEKAGLATASSRDAVGGFDRVSHSVSEIDSSIRTISDNASSVATVADDAVGLAEHTNELLSRLSTSSTQIGEVVGTINTIAEKTNLLALNATIESSRAGEAGRGFAVVANEVKELAKATALATEDIARQIETLQADAQDSTGALEKITDVVSDLNQYQTGIAAAVEEQAFTISEVSREVNESSRAGAGIGESVNALADAASETRAQLDNITASVRTLNEISGELDKSVGAFTR